MSIISSTLYASFLLKCMSFYCRLKSFKYICHHLPSNNVLCYSRTKVGCKGTSKKHLCIYTWFFIFFFFYKSLVWTLWNSSLLSFHFLFCFLMARVLWLNQAVSPEISRQKPETSKEMHCDQTWQKYCAWSSCKRMIMKKDPATSWSCVCCGEWKPLAHDRVCEFRFVQHTIILNERK